MVCHVASVLSIIEGHEDEIRGAWEKALQTLRSRTFQSTASGCPRLQFLRRTFGDNARQSEEPYPQVIGTLGNFSSRLESEADT